MTSKLTRKASGWIAGVAVTLLVILGGLFVAEAPQVYGGGCYTPFDQWISGETTSYNRALQYYFYGEAGARVSIRMERDDTSTMDPYLELADPFGTVVAYNDDSAGSSNSWINGYRLPNSGCYTIIARSYQNSTFGKFWLYASWY
ncbi:MAG: hypothetical protein BroJett011_54380 [Chloroflexota bacterium]|nr:MAG: hypothetical protein BroJett011_54380 [Chloroflexota bacterium]